MSARFVITINSNSIIEALAQGVPCLAFGPSLAINAGAVHPTTMATLQEDIKEMLKGWRPAEGAVENYLQWLAARQYRYDEFMDAELVRRLLRAVGVEPPGASA